MATLPVTLTGQPQACELVVEATPDLGDLVLEVPLLAGEAMVENNRVPFRIANGKFACSPWKERWAKNIVGFTTPSPRDRPRL